MSASAWREAFATHALLVLCRGSGSGSVSTFGTLGSRGTLGGSGGGGSGGATLGSSQARVLDMMEQRACLLAAETWHGAAVARNVAAREGVEVMLGSVDVGQPAVLQVPSLGLRDIVMLATILDALRQRGASHLGRPVVCCTDRDVRAPGMVEELLQRVRAGELYVVVVSRSRSSVPNTLLEQPEVMVGSLQRSRQELCVEWCDGMEVAVCDVDDGLLPSVVGNPLFYHPLLQNMTSCLEALQPWMDTATARVPMMMLMASVLEMVLRAPPSPSPLAPATSPGKPTACRNEDDGVREDSSGENEVREDSNGEDEVRGDSNVREDNNGEGGVREDSNGEDV